MDPSALRNFRDFLQLYNRMTEICFTRCIDNVNSRNLDGNEANCVDDCSSKFVKFNNRLMQNFVKVQTDIVNRRVEEIEKQQQLQNSAPEENHLENNASLSEQLTSLEKGTLQDKEFNQSDILVSK